MKTPTQKIIRRIRAAQKPKQVPLCHILINIRSFESYYSTPWLNKDLADYLKIRTLHRQTARRQIIEDYKYKCFEPAFRTWRSGHKTYKKNGKFYSTDPNEDLPF